jgi:hypothetical protein
LRVDPEFQHAARAMERARHLAVALQLPHVADINQHGVVAAMQLQRVLDRQRFDFALGGLDQRLGADGDRLGHQCLRPAGMVADP